MRHLSAAVSRFTSLNPAPTTCMAPGSSICAGISGTPTRGRNNARGVARPKDRLNELGGLVGRPIFIPKVYDGQRDKSFFFFTYTKDKRPVTPTLVVGTVPTARMKQGDFSELPASQVIYDPATTGWRHSHSVPGQRHPSESLQQYLHRSLLAAIPNPTRPSLTNNLDFRE